MKILVTGSAGFIGFHLAKKLIEYGSEVIGLDIINNYYDIKIKYGRLKELGISEDKITYGKLINSFKYKNFKFIKLKLEDYDNLNCLFADVRFDAVCNLAAQAGVRYSLTNPNAYIESNIVGFINVLEACRHNNVNNLAYASSSSVYGLNKSYPFSTSDNVDHPISLYAASKKSNELMAHTYSHLYKIQTTGLRFFTVYGPWGRPDMALYLFTKSIIDQQPIDVFNNGEMLRDFTYIDDIVEALKRVILKPAIANPDWNGLISDPSSSSAPYKIYNIGNNNPVRLMDFINAIEKACDRKAIINYKPLQPGDVPATYANVDDLYKNIAFKPNTSIEDGVKKFVNWYKAFFDIKDFKE